MYCGEIGNLNELVCNDRDSFEVNRFEISLSDREREREAQENLDWTICFFLHEIKCNNCKCNAKGSLYPIHRFRKMSIDEIRQTASTWFINMCIVFLTIEGRSADF